MNKMDLNALFQREIMQTTIMSSISCYKEKTIDVLIG